MNAQICLTELSHRVPRAADSSDDLHGTVHACAGAAVDAAVIREVSWPWESASKSVSGPRWPVWAGSSPAETAERLHPMLAQRQSHADADCACVSRWQSGQRPEMVSRSLQ